MEKSVSEAIEYRRSVRRYDAKKALNKKTKNSKDKYTKKFKHLRRKLKLN